MDALLRSHYRAIWADPSWKYVTRSPKGMGRSADNHYRTLTLAEMKRLPVRDVAHPDCVLLMWVTDPCLLKGIDLMQAWGFEYKTVGFTWAKTLKDGERFYMGMGHWTRANPEMCLLGTRGAPKRIEKGVRQLVVSPRREHSRKPDEIALAIERLVAGPYLELFTRSTRPGWSSWGDEIGKFSHDV